MTCVGTLGDDVGEIRYIFCDACRTIMVDAWDVGRRSGWRETVTVPTEIYIYVI